MAVALERIACIDDLCILQLVQIVQLGCEAESERIA